MRLITSADVDRLAFGTMLLGSGGGCADDELTSVALMLRHALTDHGPVRLLEPDEADPDEHAIRIALIGSPLLVREKLPSGEEAQAVLQAVGAQGEQPISAVIGWEMAGHNGLVPLLLAAQTGLPVVDVDGMGRAFPRVDQTTYAVAGLPITPCAITEPGGNLSVFSGSDIEDLARMVTVDFGGWAAMACTPLRLADAVRGGVPGAWARALELGNRWSSRPVYRHWTDPAPDAQGTQGLTARGPGGSAEVLREIAERATASGGFLLARGKVVEVARESPGGFPRGTLVLQRWDSGGFLRVEMQGEYLVRPRRR